MSKPSAWVPEERGAADIMRTYEQMQKSPQFADIQITSTIVHSTRSQHHINLSHFNPSANPSKNSASP